MRQFLSLLIVMSSGLMAMAQSTPPSSWKIPIHPKYVPLELKHEFSKTNAELDPTWYPYPYGFHQMDTLDGFLVPGSLDDAPEYFEAEYEQNHQRFRKTYDLAGEFKMLVEVKSIQEAPEDLLEKVKETHQKIIGFEIAKLIDSGSQPMFKFYVMADDVLEAIYFNDQHQRMRKTQWEFYSYPEANGLETTLRISSEDERSRIELKNMTRTIQLELKEQMKHAKIIEFWEVKPVFVPQKVNTSRYYDLNFKSVYDVLYENKKHQVFKNTYQQDGELLETVEIISLSALPKELQKYLKDVKYKDWSFDQNVEKIKLPDNSYDYRLHGIENNKEHVMIIHTF